MHFIQRLQSDIDELRKRDKELRWPSLSAKLALSILKKIASRCGNRLNLRTTLARSASEGSSTTRFVPRLRFGLMSRRRDVIERAH